MRYSRVATTAALMVLVMATVAGLDAHQVAAPSTAAGPDAAHGKASPGKPAVPAAPQSVTTPVVAVPGETHGKASSGKPAVPAAPQTTPVPVIAGRTEAPRVAPIAKSAATGAQQATTRPAEVGRGTGSARTTDARTGKAPAEDPMARATEAVDLINRMMAEQASSRTRPSVGKPNSKPITGPVGQIAGAAVKPARVRKAAQVQPHPMLALDAPRASDGVALKRDSDPARKPAPTGRAPGIHLIWPH